MTMPTIIDVVDNITRQLTTTSKSDPWAWIDVTDLIKMDPNHLAQLESSHGRKLVWSKQNRAGYVAYLYDWPMRTALVSETQDNKLYQECKPCQQLVIFKLDSLPITSWVDMQRIKSSLLGDEVEAVEIFPAESRLIDTANIRHLWIINSGARLSFGFTERGRVTRGKDGTLTVGIGIGVGVGSGTTSAP